MLYNVVCGVLCALGNRFVFFLTFRFFTFRFCKLFVVERIKETFCVCVCVFGGRWLEFLFNHYSKGFWGMIGLIFYASEKLGLAVRRCGFYAYQW